MLGVLINVGSSSRDPNGRGRINEDFTFEYLPIPEGYPTREKVPTYDDLGFCNVRYPDLPVHLDPEFETHTYGHVRRGFGDIQNLLKLSRNDVVFFFATLQSEHDWAPYIIGYFRDVEIHDCRKLSSKEILELGSRGFSNNAHLKRVDPSVNFLIRGGEGSKPLVKAFPLAESADHKTLRKPLKDTILTATGKKVRSGTPWFRWTLISNNNAELLEMIEALQKL